MSGLARAVASALALLPLLSCAEAAHRRPPAAPAAQGAPRTRPPEPAPPPPLVLPSYQRALAGHGVDVLVTERHDLPVVCASVVFGSGSAADPDGRAGLAKLSYDMLLEGARDYDGPALDAAFAMLGATPRVEVEPDGARISVTVVTGQLAPALELLGHVVLHPKLHGAAFNRRKAQQLADATALASAPSFVAQQALLQVAFGEGHPYGHTALGTPPSIERITARDAREFITRHVGPATTAVVLAGDVRMPEALQLVERAFGSWSAPAVRQATPPPVDPRAREHLFYAARPGLNQTNLMVGRPALAAGAPDEASLAIATAAIGGLFSSRLNLNLREQHGYAYGARAQLSARRGQGPWIASAAVRADATAPALDEMITELDQLRHRPLLAREVEDARRSLIASLPGEFESAEDLAAAAARIVWYGLPIDRYARLVESLRAATRAQVQDTAQRYMNPELLSVVAVGAPAILSEQLQRVRTLTGRTPIALGTAP